MFPFDGARKLFAVSLLFALGACSGGSGASTQSVGSVPATAATPSSSLPTTTQSVSFTFTQTAEPAAAARRPKYIGAGTKSVSIVVDSINGVAVPAASYTTHANITLANCPCTVSAGVPPGNDVFTITTYDGQYVSGAQQGNVISDATTPSTPIVAGQTTPVMLTLNGQPSKFAFALPASPQAGTAIPATAFTVTVEDVDGNTIIGTFAHPVTLTSSDTSGAISLATSGSDSPTSGTLLSSGDTATIAYSGLAILPATISAGAIGSASGSATFAPKLQPIVVMGVPLVANSPTYNFNQLTTSGNFTATEAGWTNAPYGKTFTIVTGGAGSDPTCGHVGTVAQSPGATTAFVASEAAMPIVGSCTITLEDFTGGSTAPIALVYQLHGTLSYGYTGVTQSYPVPSGIVMINVSMSGAAGGASNGSVGGPGGSVSATINVTPNETLPLVVGGQGGSSSAGGTAGYNGGGAGGAGGGGGGLPGGGGGGASMISDSSGLLAIAGGGGGAVIGGGNISGEGGAGGHTATAGATTVAMGGQPGTLSAGGAGGTAQNAAGPGSTNGAAGVQLLGGAGGMGAEQMINNVGFNVPGEGGGGGGGGFYGGGGGGGITGLNFSGAGGGGSSNVLAGGATFVTYTDGNTTGNGSITIRW